MRLNDLKEGLPDKEAMQEALKSVDHEYQSGPDFYSAVMLKFCELSGRIEPGMNTDGLQIGDILNETDKFIKAKRSYYADIKKDMQVITKAKFNHGVKREELNSYLPEHIIVQAKERVKEKEAIEKQREHEEQQHLQQEEKKKQMHVVSKQQTAVNTSDIGTEPVE
jgi:hypothetical protein